MGKKGNGRSVYEDASPKDQKWALRGIVVGGFYRMRDDELDAARGLRYSCYRRVARGSYSLYKLTL